MNEPDRKEKTCSVCGRKMEWRSRWAKNWEQIKYCSDQCRKAKRSDHSNIENQILELLNKRSAQSTICPSEVLPPDEKQNSTEMERVRQAARRLCHQGKLQILQKGKVVDPADFRGPIRLRLIRNKE